MEEKLGDHSSIHDFYAYFPLAKYWNRQLIKCSHNHIKYVLRLKKIQFIAKWETNR